MVKITKIAVLNLR